MRQLIIAIGLGTLCWPVFAQCVPEWAVPDPTVGAEAVTVWDEDGPGPGRPVLVVGDVNVPTTTIYWGRVATYDGRAWKSIGTPFSVGSPVWMFEDIVPAYTTGVGSPQPGLYVAGRFDNVGGEPANGLVHWDGARWKAIGDLTPTRICTSLLMFDEDGEGPGEASLFISGGFVDIGGIQYPGVVRWDGSSITNVGGGLGRSPSSVPFFHSMVEFDDDGPGPRKNGLYGCGTFDHAGGKPIVGVARWDGTNWESLGSKTTDDVRALAVFDADGPGPERPMLYAGGGFTFDPGGENISYLARWDGQAWSRMPGWIGAGGVYALNVFDDDGDGPNKPALFVSGLFTGVGGVQMNYVTKWDGDTWYPLGTGFTGMRGGVAYDMQVYDEDNDPSTPDGLYFAGVFPLAGGIPTLGFGRWGCENPICYADCDESSGLGKLDIFDFLCFQQSFVTNDPYACDCNTSTGNGVCDVFDFLCFQDAFVSGCP